MQYVSLQIPVLVTSTYQTLVQAAHLELRPGQVVEETKYEDLEVF